MKKRQLKIALLSTPRVAVPPPKYGGTELIVYNISEKLVERGHKVVVFATGDSNVSAKLEYAFKISGYKAGRPANFRPALVHCSHSFEKIKKQKFDIIHNHYGIWGIAFAKTAGIPFVTTYHGDIARDLKQDVYPYFKSIVQDTPFISISNSQKQVSPIKIKWVGTVYNGIEIEKFQYNETPKNYAVWLGRFSPDKGAKEACLCAKKTNTPLILAGRLSLFHKEEVDYFNKEIKPLIDNKKIRYIGEVNHQQKVIILKQAKILLNPITWNEPFGLVMAEAFACGTPVISFCYGSVPEVVRDIETGFIINHRKESKQKKWHIKQTGITGFCKAIKAIYSLTKKDYKYMRQACRIRVEKNFSTDCMVNGYESIYRKIINN